MKRFTKRKEDFVCENCGRQVIGDGYTNHCPYCLWGKHVDVNPGDRLAGCGGMMRPVWVEKGKGRKEYGIIHVCQKCGQEKRNRIASNDDFDRLAAIQSDLLSR